MSEENTQAIPLKEGAQDSQTQEPAKKIGRFEASREVVKASWNLLKKDKEMMAFPVISAVATILVVATIVAVFVFAVVGLGDSIPEENNNVSLAAEALFAFTLYFAITFVAIFFEAAIIFMVRGRLNGQDLTLGNALKLAFGKIGKIFIWSLLSATIGTVLRMIAERSNLLGKFVVGLLGAAWGILTFFIAPVLVAEDLSVKDSLKKSASVIKGVWGETVIINIGVGAFFGIISLFGFLIFFISLFTANNTVIISTGVALVLFLTAIAVISSTLGVIFRVVLYEYANSGKVPEGFSPEIIAMAFKQK